MESKVELPKRRIYVSSYYQSKEHKEAFDKSLSLQSEEAVAINKRLTEEEILVRGVLQISQANYEKLSKIKCYYAPSSDYVVGLQCDIEVALQEEKLKQLADKFGFEFIDETNLKRKPSLEHKAKYSMEDVTLDQKDLIQGNVYVINTHGKQQQIDGPYLQAVMKINDVQRILVDACSSASSVFPIKNSGNRSVVDIVADECIKKSGGYKFEIVGYKHPFHTENSVITALAAFATEEKINGLEQSILKLITLEDRQKQLMETGKAEEQKAIQAKLENFKKATKDLSTEMALKNSLIDISSKLIRNIFLIKNPSPLISSIKEKAMVFVVDITGSEQFKVGAHDKHFVERIKEEKKKYINSLEDKKKLVNLAKSAIEIYTLVPSSGADKDKVNSIELLRMLLENYPLEIDNEETSKNLESQELRGQRHYTPSFFPLERIFTVNATATAVNVIDPTNELFQARNAKGAM